jgi:hypothetical protein
MRFTVCLVLAAVLASALNLGCSGGHTTVPVATGSPTGVLKPPAPPPVPPAPNK